jgi:ubiquinone/menaquinone biosynthesis C-methylase UbiE
MRKLEIGPGQVRTPDGQPRNTWNTVDTHYSPTHKASWGRDPLPADNNSYDWVHASHVLEHIPWWNVRKAVSEVHRILKPGGIFTVWVPDAVKIFKQFLDDPDGLVELEQRWPCGNLNKAQDAWTYLNARVFWGARPGELGQEQHFHRSMFGAKSLAAILKQCGFSSTRYIERNTEVDPGHGWMECGLEGTK